MDPASRSHARILLAGPLPPPVNGMILVTQAVHARLRARYAVVVVNTTTGRLGQRRRPVGMLVKLLRYLGLWLRLPLLRARGCTVVYMPLDSSWGLLFNLITLLSGRPLGQRFVLHHHVTNYLVQPSRLMAGVNALTGARDLQIFNCDAARRTFTERYGARAGMLAVSNSAFVELDVERTSVGRSADGVLRLGHMSVLTIEKGLDLVLELLARLIERDLPVVLVLAGPVHQPAAARALAEAQRAFPHHIDYRGPVSGQTKRDFFANIDVFVFPTRYAKESEPLVLVEALTSGRPVMTYRRGCIGDIVGRRGGLALDPQAPFVPPAVALCERYLNEPGALVAAQEEAYAQAGERARAAAQARDRLLDHLDPAVRCPATPAAPHG
jgi:glycosyltransferase involved in cell wall biosynthesis